MLTDANQPFLLEYVMKICNHQADEQIASINSNEFGFR